MRDAGERPVPERELSRDCFVRILSGESFAPKGFPGFKKAFQEIKIMKTINAGTESRSEFTVGGQDLASVYGSGSLPVYATPAMVALMEKTACKLIEPYLEAGETTVGIAIEAKHLKATLPGMKVTCLARLSVMEGRKLVFEIEVSDALSMVGMARHERFLVFSEAFLEKAEENKKACAR